MTIQRIRAMPYGLRGFVAFCGLLRLEDGSSMKIAPFQKSLLALYFGGVVELVIIMPKKNGKTTLMGALGLYHLLMTPAAECVIGAASEEQAAILYRQARTMVLQAGLERKPRPPKSHRDRVEYEGYFDVRPGIHEIRFEHGRIRVLPADIRTAQGVIPTLALVDEYHMHSSSGVYAIFRDGLTPRNGQMITITNPGMSFDSPLGKLREKMLECPVHKTGRRRLYRSKDGTNVLVEWGLEPSDDTDNINIVKMANPAPWQTKKALRRRRDSSSTTSAEWLRYGCGLWSAGDGVAVDAVVWERAKADIGGICDGDEVVLAPSVGHNAAVGIAAAREDGRIACRAEIIDPIENTSIFVRTEQAIMDLCDRYDVREVQYPLAGFIRSSDFLRAEGIPMVEAPHSPARMAAATGTFDRLLTGGMLIHDGDPKLRDHVLAGRRKVNETGERFDMSSDRSRALTAITFAVHAASAAPKRKPMIHVWRGQA
jgi:phage terminase large subunit-like protein